MVLTQRIGGRAATHTLLPTWVIHVISSEHRRRPLHTATQLQTFRCVALSDVQGQKETSQRAAAFSIVAGS